MFFELPPNAHPTLSFLRAWQRVQTMQNLLSVKIHRITVASSSGFLSLGATTQLHLGVKGLYESVSQESVPLEAQKAFPSLALKPGAMSFVSLAVSVPCTSWLVFSLTASPSIQDSSLAASPTTKCPLKTKPSFLPQSICSLNALPAWPLIEFLTRLWPKGRSQLSITENPRETLAILRNKPRAYF